MSNTSHLIAYVSAFNILQNGLPYKEPLCQMLAFFDKVVVAVNTSTDSTLVALQSLAGQIENAGRLHVIETSFRYDDVTFDGAIKDAALQEAVRLTGGAPDWVYVQMDLDETPLLGQRDLWRTYASQLLANPNVDAFMIPSLDVWGSMDTIRADQAIGLKFRLHKGGLKRGVWERAWLPGRKRFRTDMSDSGELLNQHGELARGQSVVPQHLLHPTCAFMLAQYPLTVHLGYLDLAQRVRVNKAIWAAHWTLRNGGEDARVAITETELRNVPLVPHRLILT